ncbi:hypothetical protein [Paenibacillus senegalensis]|uniref:hypothetical protein n=1 Tax=Paenibacillus senegalensis TaxID=1465766 RepID=UPI0002899D2F|nr:hypothetical protein [Paenibacillus senegalensis]
MKVKQKTVAAVLAFSMAGTMISALPLSGQGLAAKWGIVQTAYAAEDSFYNERFIERMREFHSALHQGTDDEVQSVRNLRDEIKGLTYKRHGHLIDPVWNKLRGKVDPSSKEILFNFIVAVGGMQYDPDFANLEEIRTDPAFHAAIQGIATAGGQEDLTIEHIMEFIFGSEDGSKPGMEGTIQSLIARRSMTQLIPLLASETQQNALLREALSEMLEQTDTYEVSAILANLGITEQNLMDTLMRFRKQLRHDSAAQNALILAYVRSEIQERVVISEDGRQHRYSLELFGFDIPNNLVRWRKSGGSPDVTVTNQGVVSIPEQVATATATIEALILNRVIFSKEVTLIAEENPSDDFLQDYIAQMNSIISQLANASDAEKRRLVQEAVWLSQQTWGSLTTVEADEMVRVIAGNAIFRPETSDVLEAVEEMVNGEAVIRDYMQRVEAAAEVSLNDRFLTRTFGFNLSSVEEDRLDIIIPKAVLDEVLEANITDIYFQAYGMRMFAPIGQFNGDLLLSIQKPAYEWNRLFSSAAFMQEVYEIEVQESGQTVTELEEPIRVEVSAESGGTTVEFKGGEKEGNLIIEQK